MMYFQNGAEPGPKYFADVATASCVLKNSAPVIEPIGDKTVKEGELLTFTVKASDENGDVITYSAKNLPSGSTFIGQTISIQVNDAIPPCIVPKDGMKIADDIYLCPGSYLITAPLVFDADSTKLDCQGATIYGNDNAQPIIAKNKNNENNQAAITILSKANKIYRNNFINNGGLSGYPANQQVVIPAPITENIFTVNGQGNYWSNYDEPSESCFDDDVDDICDNAFNKIAQNNYDLVPYLKPNGWIK